MFVNIKKHLFFYIDAINKQWYNNDSKGSILFCQNQLHRVSCYTHPAQDGSKPYCTLSKCCTLETDIMAKKKTVDIAAKLATELKMEYQQWDDCYKNGRHDPFWSDGTNLELIRNHIIYAKSQCEELLSPEQYPEEYHWPLPPIVKQSYMARPAEIRKNAMTTLQDYEADPNFRFIVSHLSSISKKSEFLRVIGYVQTLKIAIARDDLVDMRRHEQRSDLYLKSFAAARQRMEEQLREERKNQESAYEQLSLFA